MSEEHAHQASTVGINPLDGEVVKKNVHPSWVNWKKRLLAAPLLLVLGATTGGSAGVVAMGIGALCVVTAYLARRRSRYIVTNQRVKGKLGLLSTETFETRLNNINGISTSSGFVEGLVGKGTVSITDAAGETLGIEGVGDYETLARTLREQHQEAAQPGRGGHPRGGPARGPAATQQGARPPRQPAGSAQGQHPRNDAAATAEQNRSRAEPRAAETESHGTGTSGAGEDDATETRCRACDSLVDADVSFCPECGTEEPFSPSTDRGDGGARPAESDETATEPETESASGPGAHPVAAVAASIADRRRPDSSVATELCRALAAEEGDERRLEDALEDAVETLETTAAVTEAVEGIDDPSRRRRLESARRTLADERGRLPAALEPVLERTIAVSEELEACESERDRLRDAAGAVCRAANRHTDVRLGGDDVADRATRLADAIESGDLGDEPSEPVVAPVADELERSVRPQSPQSRELLETLAEPESEEISSVLRSTVDSLDGYAELRAAVADIGERDVRRRLDALDDELEREDGDVYRHLADRVRELEAMLERDGVTDVQLYAIYQECTFYDRTLLPRLSRSRTDDGPAALGRTLAGVEERIDAIEREYIDVRADHNHTIPRHFLSLADDLLAEARRAEGEQPMRAAGLLSAADDVLDRVEALYERNEYSVMLRRLRG